MVLLEPQDYQIYKAAGVLIADRKLLVARAKGKDFFFSPGGKIEKGETPKQALRRELAEELDIDVSVDDMDELADHYAEATDKPGVILRQVTFLVKDWSGDIKPSSEIEELAWVGSGNPDNIPMGTIYGGVVLPMLYDMKLVD